MKQKSPNYFIIFSGALLLFLVSTGIAYFAFTSFSGKRTSVSVNEDLSSVDANGNFIVDDSLPRTETCPLNGKLYSKPERAIWEKRRPMGVMIENHIEARPQSGLSSADIVYETIAEGGITRFLAIFYCGVAENTNFAPVRSARVYYMDWVSEYSSNPLYVHVGGANCSAPYPGGPCNSDSRVQAIEKIDQIGWGGVKGNDLNQFSLEFPICYKNPDRLGRQVATEHQMVCQSTLLYNEAKERGWTNTDEDGIVWNDEFVSWKFKEDAKPSDRGTVDTIELYFWESYGEYNVTWEYDVEQNLYKRFNGGQPHMDIENDKQLIAKNIIVQFTDEEGPVDELKHLFYDTIGSGNALFFQDGTVIEGTWSKKSRTARTKYFDDNGKEIEFVNGEIWVEVVSTGNDVTYVML